MSWDHDSIEKAERALAQRAKELVAEMNHPTASPEAKTWAAELLLMRAAHRVRED